MGIRRLMGRNAAGIRFLLSVILMISALFCFPVTANAEESLDWEAYIASDKYIVRIDTRDSWYPGNDLKYAPNKGDLRPEEDYKHFWQGQYYEYMGNGSVVFRAFDAGTGEEIVCQELWYKMEGVDEVINIIPAGASYPVVHIDNRDGYENYHGEYVSDNWGEANAGYSVRTKEGSDHCHWEIKYTGWTPGHSYSLLERDESKLYEEKSGLYPTKMFDDGEHREENYAIGDSRVIGVYDSVTRDSDHSHYEEFNAYYEIFRKLPDVPYVLFLFEASYKGHADREYDTEKYKGPGELLDTFQDLRRKIEDTVVQSIATAPFIYEWQEPVWFDSAASEEVSVIISETEHHAELEAGEDTGADIGWDIVEPSKPVVKPQTSSGSGDKKTSLPKAIGVAVGGALAGAGAAGALGGGNGGSPGNSSGNSPDSSPKETADDEKKRYKMFISKDFGDAVKKGAPPVTVRARIVEISTKSGLQKPRPDLTERITVSGEGLQTGSVTMDGMWLNVQVYAEEESTAKEGTVVFIFNGEGGRFHNRIVFRLVGKPYIVFPDTPSYSDGMYLKMIANDPETYSVRFFFEDAVGEPEKLLLSGGDGFRTRVREAENVRTYYADVAEISGTDRTSLYTAPEREYIGIHAEFADGDIVDSGFHVEIWPEGISVNSRHVKNDRLMIDTVPNPDAGDLDYTIRPTEFEVKLAYRDSASGKPVFLTGEDMKPRFSDLYQVERYGKTFTDNFRYTINTQFDLYAFEPQDTLPMLKDPYEAMMDIECEAGGEVYAQSMPLGFYGEKPLLPSNAEWQAVYQKLKRDVQIFGVGSDPQVRAMIREARKMSAADLEFVRYWIILCGKQYYENERREYAAIDKVMTNYIVVASALVKIGDKAVEVAIKIKWPNADAALIAAFVNPWKNAMAEFIGQYVAKFSFIDLAEGDPEDFEFFKTMISSCENTLSEVITGTDDRPVDPKVMGRIVSLYLLICFAKHYFYGEGNEKGDIFKSTVEALKDLTLTKLKAYFTDLLKKGGEYLGKIAEFAGKALGRTLKYVGLENANLIAKNVFELQLRMAYAKDGTLSNAAYDAASAMKDSMKGQYLEGIGKEIAGYTEGALKWTAEYVVAGILNYLAKGTKKENECLGLTTPEVLVEWTADRREELLKLLAEVLKERYGIDIMKYYMAAEAAMDISVKLDGEFLIMSFYGYTVEINIIENAEALMGIAYEACFGWMEDLWKCMQSNDPAWDPRDDLSDDTTMVERMAERVRNLGSSGDITYKDI